MGAASYKLKTNKACKKRYKKTGKGNFLAKQAGLKHINAKMSSSRKRKLRSHRTLRDVNAKRLERLLPYA
jgi:large subunit ribosomal protein L35